MTAARAPAFLFFLSLVGCLTTTPLVLLYRPQGMRVETFRSDPPLTITIYPGNRDHYDGAVIFLHGGGWTMGGSEVPLFQDWAPLLERARLRGVGLEHRVAPAFRGMDLVSDCMDGVRYVEANAERLHFPSDRIGLVGFSSGGHLAVMAALELSRLERGPLRAVVSYYAPLNFELLLLQRNPAMLAYLKGFLPEEYSASPDSLAAAMEELTPIRRLHAGAPPILLVHGLSDELVPPEQSASFTLAANKLRDGMAEFVPVENGRHNFNQSRSQWARQVDEAAVAFLRRHVAQD